MTEFDAMPAEDAQACRMIGWFFATNPHLARECHPIEEITLTCQGEGKPPLAKLTIRKGKRAYRLMSNEAGQVPKILGQRILHNPKHRRQRPRREGARWPGGCP